MFLADCKDVQTKPEYKNIANVQEIMKNLKPHMNTDLSTDFTPFYKEILTNYYFTARNKSSAAEQ